MSNVGSPPETAPQPKAAATPSTPFLARWTIPSLLLTAAGGILIAVSGFLPWDSYIAYYDYGFHDKVDHGAGEWFTGSQLLFGLAATTFALIAAFSARRVPRFITTALPVAAALGFGVSIYAWKDLEAETAIVRPWSFVYRHPQLTAGVAA